MQHQTTIRRGIFRLYPILLATLMVCISVVARAGDGRVEINQAAALAGSLPIDSPGFPVDLYEGGSYVLTSDLVVADAGTTAIRVFTSGSGSLPDANDVTLDLNGFTIRGPATCTGEGTTLSCSGSTAIGIDATGGALRTVVVHGGQVSGFGTGIILPITQAGCIVRDTTVTGNVFQGISTFFGTFGSPRFPCLILRNRVFGNGRYGIVTDGPTLARDNTIHGNGLDGMRGVFDVLVSHGNTLHTNAERGIYIQTTVHALISNTAVENSGLSGIEFASAGARASLLIDNTVRNNGMTATPAEPQLNRACAVGYVQQVLTSGPAGGPTTGGCSSDLAMDPNLCNGSLTCP